MRLLICDYDIEIDIQIGSPKCICVENPKMYRDLVGDIWAQGIGIAGGNILSEDSGKELSIYKDATVVINPFAVDLNEKKLINKLYQNLSQIVTEELYEQSSMLNSKAIELIDAVANSYPYPIEYDLDIDIQALFKMYKLRFPSEDGEVIDNLLNYCKMRRRICEDNFFIFTNLKQIMSSEELEDFYNDLKYEQIYSLDIESNYTYKVKNENCIIVDNDLCIINID